MKFTIKTDDTAINIMRACGYKFLGAVQDAGELAFSKRLGAHEFPRFHMYIKQKKEGGRNILECNLHLDQKRASYDGCTAHSADYNSSIIKNEANYIISNITKK